MKKILVYTFLVFIIINSTIATAFQTFIIM